MVDHEYTHTDESGMQWRFEGNRPISKLADDTIDKVQKTATTGKYILEGKKVVPCYDLYEWADWFEKGNDSIIGRTQVTDSVLVSTVFLGIDHSYIRQEGDPDHQPILFETMVFGGAMDRYQERYTTYEQAEKGHDYIVSVVKTEFE